MLPSLPRLPILVVAALVGCRPTAPTRLTVFAASSLVDVLPKIAEKWSASGGIPIRFSWGATSKLVPQVIQGAPADLIFSADEEWMDRLDSAGRTAPGTRTIIARNELVVVVPADSRVTMASGADVVGPAIETLALAGEQVPAGKYATAALRSLGLWDRIRDRVRRGDDVRVALRWVALGEVDAGIVYRTDARAEPRVRIVWAIPDSLHPPIVYPAAVIVGSAQLDRAAAFLEFCRESVAQALLAADGFVPVSR